MKYMYLNTLNFIRSKENRIFLIYLLAVIIGSFYFIDSKSCVNILYTILGVNYSYSEHSNIDFIYFCFNLLYGIFISLNLFFQDSKKNYDTIFLRMTTLKWIIYKIFTVFITLFLIKFLMYFIVILVGIFNNCVPNLNIILVFFTDLSISFLTSLIIILVYLLNKKNKIYLVISVFLIVVIIGVISFNIVELVNFLPLIFLAILAVFLLIMEVFKKLSYLYFE